MQHQKLSLHDGEMQRSMEHDKVLHIPHQTKKSSTSSKISPADTHPTPLPVKDGSIV
jgi:hypothetical protein